MKKKDKLLIKISILIGFLIILTSLLMMDNDRTIIPIRLKDDKELVVDKLPEEYNNLNVKMITNYSIPASQITTKTNLTETKEKTVIAFWISGIDNISDVFKSLTLYESRKEKKCDITILNKNKNNIYVIAICDGYVDFGSMFVTLGIKDPKSKNILTLEGTVINETQEILKDIAIGDIFYVMDTDCWYRLNNDNLKISEQKQDKNGKYYEYEKTLNFFTFGYYTNIDTSKIKIISDIPYENEINYEIYEIENDEKTSYKRKNTTGKKQICVTFKVYMDKLDEKVTKDIENSYISYDDKKISLKD